MLRKHFLTVPLFLRETYRQALKKNFFNLRLILQADIRNSRLIWKVCSICCQTKRYGFLSIMPMNTGFSSLWQKNSQGLGNQSGRHQKYQPSLWEHLRISHWKPIYPLLMRNIWKIQPQFQPAARQNRLKGKLRWMQSLLLQAFWIIPIFPQLLIWIRFPFRTQGKNWKKCRLSNRKPGKPLPSIPISLLLTQLLTAGKFLIKMSVLRAVFILRLWNLFILCSGNCSEANKAWTDSSMCSFLPGSCPVFLQGT